MKEDEILRTFYEGLGDTSVQPIMHGVISYFPSRNRLGYANLGDEFQSIAAAWFLPRVDAFIPRDNLNLIFPTHLRENIIKLILPMGARFYGDPSSWPPPKYIQPIFVGVRLELKRPNHQRVFSQERVVRYLNEHGPVGCRDLDTCNFLQSRNVDAVLTGCMTFTLRRSDFVASGQTARRNILMIDVPKAARPLLPTKIWYLTGRRSQLLSPRAPQTQKHRTKMAMSRLTELATARMVITTKVHAAFACRAMGTPVALLDVGGDISSRLSGLKSMFHYFDLKEESDRQRLLDFSWNDPPKNPDSSLFSKLVARSLGLLSKHGLKAPCP